MQIFIAVRWIVCTIFGVSALNEHAALFGSADPAGLGFAPVPLGLSYRNVNLKVEGQIPAYVNGTLYRGAPGDWPDGWWLDGLITLNAFKFSGGKVLYTMQYNKDQVYNKTLAHNASQAPHYASGAHRGTIPHPANTSFQTGVAFRQVQGNLLGSTGVSNTNQVDFDTLDPIEMPFVYDDDLGAPYLAPTHDQTIDGVVLHHLVTSMQEGSSGKPSYIVTSISPGTRKRNVIATIESPKESSPSKGYPSFQHMPLATPEYYIMLEAPCYYPSTLTPVGQVDWKGWRSNIFAKTHVRLVSRSTGESILYPLSHGVFSIHHINAYKDTATNSIVVDTIQTFPSLVPCSMAFQRMTVDSAVKDWKMQSKGLSGSKPLRIILPLGKPGTEVTPVPLTNITGMEFPTIRYDDCNGKPYHYAYGVWMTSSSAAYYDALVKLDVQTGACKSWHVEGHYPGEPIFVPNPGGTSEDDGVVMTNVLDVTKNQTYLVILDGKTMQQVARAGPTPHVIPHGFHGRYFNRKLNAIDSNDIVFV